MGYACPVCGTPQADARHLANHLAFTAMLHGDDHESWLDEHVPGWTAAGEHELADRVREPAPEADYPQVFEDTTDRASSGGHEHGRDDPSSERSGALFDEAPASGETTGSGSGVDVDPAASRERGAGELDAETREIVAEARELTRKMLAEDEDAERS